MASEEDYNKSSIEKIEIIKISKLTNFPKKVIISQDLKN